MTNKLLCKCTHKWWEHVLIEKKIANKTKHEFINLDLPGVDFHENSN